MHLYLHTNNNYTTLVILTNDKLQLSKKVDEDVSVGLEAFCRISPAVPIIANVIISENLFEVLSSSTGGRLQFFIYDKYLSGLERYWACGFCLEICSRSDFPYFLSILCMKVIFATSSRLIKKLKTKLITVIKEKNWTSAENLKSNND